MSAELINELSAKDRRPVLVALVDMAGNVTLPIPLHPCIIIQVKLAIDDLPVFRVALGGIAL